MPSQEPIRFVRRSVASTMLVALLLVACTGSATVSNSPDTTESGETDPAVAPQPADGPEAEAVTNTSTGFDLAFVLPGWPDDPNVPEPVSSTGEPVDPDHLNIDQYYLWCGGESDNALATLVVGDIWQTFEGAGFVAELSSNLEVGPAYSLPISSDQLVLFFVDLHGIEGIPEEYATAQEESHGSVTFEALPCGDDGDELAFTVDGAFGAETNPGFTSAVMVNGSVRLTQTAEPPPELFGPSS